MQQSSRSVRMERLRNENLARRQRQQTYSHSSVSTPGRSYTTGPTSGAHNEHQQQKLVSSLSSGQHQQVHSPSDWSRSSLQEQQHTPVSAASRRGNSVKSRSVLEVSPHRSQNFSSSIAPDDSVGGNTGTSYHLAGDDVNVTTTTAQSPLNRNYRSRQNQISLPEIESIGSASSMISGTSDSLSMTRTLTRRRRQSNNNQQTSQNNIKGAIKRQSTDDTGSTSGAPGPYLLNLGENGAYSDDERTRSSIREEVLGDCNELEARMNGVQRARFQQEKEQMRRKEEMARRRGKGSIYNPFIETANNSSALNQEQWLRPDNGDYRTGNTVNVEAFSIGKSTQDDDFSTKMKELGNSPLAKTAAGVSAIALVGCVIGPVGIVIGAAAVGAGIGAMQLPEEKRNKIQTRAVKFLDQANEHARVLNETVGTSCVQVCEKTGIDRAAEKMNIPLNCEPIEDKNKMVLNVRNPDSDLVEDNTLDDGTVVDQMSPRNVPVDGDRQAMMMPRVNLGNRKVACFRRCRIVPVSQIHSLDPSAQPRAWLDVMASILTTRDEKNEAMEEILILAKDKRHARMFLEEGLLDSLMWILSGFFKKYSALLRLTDDYNTATAYANEKLEAGVRRGQNTPVQGADNYVHARLAANCCVTLGKAHCAIVHTEGDLLLMSAYNRGTVPIERQLAQMLFEVPHHTRVTTANMDASTTTEQNVEGDEFFTLKELTMQEAEHLAKLIKNVCDGKMDKQFGYNQLEVPPDL